MSQFRLMTAIVMTSLIAIAGTAAWAQDGARNSCVDACRQTEEQCIEICGTHDNPVECEEDCQDAAYDCTNECR